MKLTETRKNMNVHMEMDVLDWLKEQAELERVPTSHVVRRLLQKAMDEAKEQEGDSKEE